MRLCNDHMATVGDRVPIGTPCPTCENEKLHAEVERLKGDYNKVYNERNEEVERNDGLSLKLESATAEVVRLRSGLSSCHLGQHSRIEVTCLDCLDKLRQRAEASELQLETATRERDECKDKASTEKGELIRNLETAEAEVERLEDIQLKRENSMVDLHRLWKKAEGERDVALLQFEEARKIIEEVSHSREFKKWFYGTAEQDPCGVHAFTAKYAVKPLSEQRCCYQSPEMAATGAAGCGHCVVCVEKQNRELLESLRNMAGLFDNAVSRLKLGKAFTPTHEEVCQSVRATLEKYTEKQVDDRGMVPHGPCGTLVAPGLMCPKCFGQ